jgi:NADPH-dependent glutamate synthase beta subunit-like oxidoreductase
VGVGVDGADGPGSGRVEAGLYAAGWLRRGPNGIVGTNVPDGRDVAAAIAVREAVGNPF